jgi:UDP-N-acetylmuramate dehydrogenase
VRPREDFSIAYRRAEGVAGEWFVAATFRFEHDDTADPATIRTLLARRSASQPLGVPSCGSVFRNPPGDHAGRLVEAAGLKGYRIGGAAVSDKHANFIINDGSASAADIEALIEHVRREVARLTGVELETEVRIVGDPLGADADA